MAEKAKNRGLYIVSESVPPLNVIKVTTSETMRLGSPDKVPRQPAVPSTMLSTNVGQKKKASSFQITSVTESVASKVSVDGGDDSADDLEDSRTEDISDNIDISKMSLDLEPSGLSYDPYMPGAQASVQSDEVFITNAIPSPIIPSAEGHYGIAIVSTQGQGGDSKRVGNTTVTAETVITFPVTSKSGEVTADLSQWQSRFKIVKIERTEPYKRGRWECMDFSDQPASQGEGIKVDGTPAHSSATLVNGSPTGRTDPSHEGITNPQPGSVCHSALPGNFTSSIPHPKPSPMSTPSLQGVAGKVALGSPSNQMLTSSTPVTAPGLTGLVSQGLVQCGQAGTVSHSAGNQIAPIVSSVVSGSIRVVQGGTPQSIHVASVNQSPVTFPKVAGTGAQVANAQSNAPVPGPQHSGNIPIRPLPAVSTSIATQTLIKNASCNTADFQPLPSATVSPSPNIDFQATHTPQQSKATVTQPTSIPNKSTAPQTCNVASVCLSSGTKPQPNQQASSPLQPPHISHPSSGNIALNVKTDASYSTTGNNSTASVATGGSSTVKSPVVGQSIGQPTLPFNSLIKESEENASADQAHLSLEVTLGEIYGGTGTDDPSSGVGLSDDTECASGSSTVAIDNKIEQAMDLVKSHLMFAVREEVEVLKERITELSDRINQLEHENTILRSHATQETLSQLCTAVSSKPPVSTGTSSNPATFDGRL